MTNHTCIRDDGGTPNRRCVACDEERDNFKAAWEASAELAKRQIEVAAEVRKERNALRAERDAARQFGEEAAAQYNALLASVTCAFCGAEYPRGTPRHGDGALRDHIAVCTEHPMREVERERDAALALLRRILDNSDACPVCCEHHRSMWSDGHAKGCELDAFLAATRR